MLWHVFFYGSLFCILESSGFDTVLFSGFSNEPPGAQVDAKLGFALKTPNKS